MSEVVIFGAGDYARIAAAYLDADSDHHVVGFSVDGKYKDRDELVGKPVLAFEDMVESHPPDRVKMLVAVGFSGLNEGRKSVYERCKKLGYEFVTYVNSRAYQWGHLEIGENTFIFEANVLQPFVEVGANVVLWSGNHIGHHSRIAANCFFSSHVVLSGFVNVGEGCFMGVNSTVANNLTIGSNCTIGAGALILRDVDDSRTVIGMWRGAQRADAAAPQPG